MDEVYEAKDYIVIDQSYVSEDGSVGRGLLIGEFDTLEEAYEFVNEHDDTSDLVIFGPKGKIE